MRPAAAVTGSAAVGLIVLLAACNLDSTYVIDTLRARSGRPTVVGSYTANGYITGVAGHRLSGTSIAFLAEDSAGLAVVDFADPASPIEIARLTWPAPYSSVSGVEEFIFVYVLQGSWGLRVVDARDPRNPVEIGSLEVPSHSISGMETNLGHQTQGDPELVYLRVYPSMILAIDVHDPTGPLQRGSCDLAVEHPGVAVQEMVAGSDHLLVVSSDKGVHLLDVSDPDQLRETGYLELGGGATYAIGIRVGDPSPKRVCVATSAAGGTDVVYLNIEDRARPTVEHTVRLPGNTSKGFMTIDTFYLVQSEYPDVGTGSDTGLWGVSYVEWMPPHLVSYCALDGEARFTLVDVAGGTIGETSCAFVALGNKTLQVVALPEYGVLKAAR